MDDQASIYDRKTDARRFGIFQGILRPLSLAKALLKEQNTPNWRLREPTHMTLSGTDKLRVRSKGSPRRKFFNVFNWLF